MGLGARAGEPVAEAFHDPDCDCLEAVEPAMAAASSKLSFFAIENVGPECSKRPGAVLAWGTRGAGREAQAPAGSSEGDAVLRAKEAPVYGSQLVLASHEYAALKAQDMLGRISELTLGWLRNPIVQHVSANRRADTLVPTPLADRSIVISTIPAREVG